MWPGAESLFGNYEGRCGEGFWLWPRRRVPSIPAAGCKERANAGHGQKTRRPEGFRGKGRLASPCSRMLSELLRGGRAQRLLRRACHPAFSPKTAPLVVSKQALRAVAGRQASTQPPLATSATSDRAAVGSGIGAVRKPRLAWAVCGGCRLKAAFPDRVRRPRPAWLPAEGRQALRPAWPQPAAPPMHRPAGKPLDQDWRGRTSMSAERVGCAEMLNG